MPRLAISSLLVAFVAVGCNQHSTPGSKFVDVAPLPQTAKAADAAETKYLVFQVWPTQPGYPGIPPEPGRLSLSKAQMEGFVRDVAKAIGTKGDAHHKLGFAVGPFSFDVPDDETRQWIRDAFAVAREKDVAVALHIDDSMSWGKRKDLLSNPDNIETADWKQIPNKARSLAWGPKPTEFPPQMCYNAPAIVAAAKDRAGLIGAEIKRELAVLKSAGKEHLFAGVIAGWETQISPEFGTHRRLGFRALAHRGFSEKNPPKDLDAERVSVVKEWMELWGNSLHAAGTPRERIFCHIAFTDQGLRKPSAKETYAEKVHFALPEVAFSAAYRPGFSTYPEGRTFKEVYAVLEKHASPGWISAEGTNVSPTSMPGEPTMETYLGRVFNHGGVLVNIFSWGIGGEAIKNNFFRKATENFEALGAYAKFLRGEKLVESGTSFSEVFHGKMQRIQTELPGWIKKTERQADAMPMLQKVVALAKEKKWREADKQADELLNLIKGDQPKKEKKDSRPLQERLPAKLHSIQKNLPTWIGTDADKAKKATGLMKQLQEHLKAKMFEEAEKIADAILKMMGISRTQEVPSPAKKAATPKESAAAANTPPNIVVLLADDLGYADVGFQGCKDVPTPRIDSIATKGVRCSNGYVSCVYCSPSRAGLITGRYQQRYGHEFNPSRDDEPRVGLPLSETTMADRLKAAGYVTGIVGKWHLGSKPEFHPQKRGFDEFFGFYAGAHLYLPIMREGKWRTMPVYRDTRAVSETTYLTDAFAREALALIDRHKDKPFFLYLPFNAVHAPLQATDKHLRRFASIKDEKRRTYAAMLAAMDEAVGQVLDKLRSSGLEEKTLIFFFSDNGGSILPSLGFNYSRNDPLRGSKGQTLEGGIRVPFAVQWKGRLPAGKVYKQPVIQLDILTTALAAAGVKIDPGWKLDGVDLLPYLEGKQAGVPHDALYWRVGPQMAIRPGDWKLVKYDKSPPKLYNLTKDVGETNDLSATHPDKAKEMQEAWQRWSVQLAKPAWSDPWNGGFLTP